MNTLNEILDFAIEREQEAVEFYHNLSLNSSDNEMKNVFLQFSQEEMAHKARLLKIKETGLFTTQENKVTDLKISDYIVNTIVKPDITYQEALVVAMQREKSAFRLYQNLAIKAPSIELKNIFLSLAQEEAKHKLRFEIEYDEYVLREN